MALPESTQVHPKALVDSEDIGERTRIWAFVHIEAGAHVGSDCNICDFAKIYSDVRIGDRVTVKERAIIGGGADIEDDVFISPSVVLPNDKNPRSPRMAGVAEVRRRYSSPDNWLGKTRICQGATLGTGAIISPGLTIGQYALVGAGALVTKDVPPFRLVVGMPARAVGWACHPVDAGDAMGRQ